jgi:hypothetical protein
MDNPCRLGLVLRSRRPRQSPDHQPTHADRVERACQRATVRVAVGDWAAAAGVPTCRSLIGALAFCGWANRGEDAAAVGGG